MFLICVEVCDGFLGGVVIFLDIVEKFVEGDFLNFGLCIVKNVLVGVYVFK